MPDYYFEHFKIKTNRKTYNSVSNTHNSWVKRDQLDVTCFIIPLLNAQHVSDVNTSILRSLRLMCWVISWVVLIWFDARWSYLVVWLWWCGIRMQAEALVLSLFNAQHVSDVNTPILRSLWLICIVISWVVLFWFDMYWCYVVVWLGLCGIRMQAEALLFSPSSGYHTTPAKPQRNTNAHRTRSIQPMK